MKGDYNLIISAEKTKMLNYRIKNYRLNPHVKVCVVQIIRTIRIERKKQCDSYRLNLSGNVDLEDLRYDLEEHAFQGILDWRNTWTKCYGSVHA